MSTELGFNPGETVSDVSKTIFLPEKYRPRRIDRAKLHDRGPNEPGHRYVLVHLDSGAYVTLSDEDRQLWEMFDGERSVQDLLRDYVKSFRTLPLDRIVRLVRELWVHGFLANDPRLSGQERIEQLPAAGAARNLGNIRIPLPLFHRLPTALGHAGFTRVVGIPVLFLSAVIAVCGLCLAYLYRVHFVSYLRLFRNPGALPELILFAALLNGLLSLLRETVRAVVATADGIQVTGGGIRLRWFVPLIYFDYPTLIGCSRKTRLAVWGSGPWFDLVCAGLASTLWYVCDFSSAEIMVLVLLLSYVRLALATCPFMDNDVYSMAADCLDDPNLRRRTWGFVQRHFGRSVQVLDRGQYASFMAAGLFCVVWIDCVLGVGYSLAVGPGRSSGPGAVAAILLGLPVLLIAVSLILWGSRIVADNFRRQAAGKQDPSTVVFELVGLGMLTLFTFFLPGIAREVFTLNVVFLTFMAIFYVFINNVPRILGGRATVRFAILGLFAQILWIPVLSLFYHTVAVMYFPVPWITFVTFVVLAVAYFAVSVSFTDFLNKGPVLEIAEGLVWLGFPVLIISTAEILRLGRLLEDLGSHPFMLSGLVLGAGLVFLGFVVPARFCRRCVITAQPFPFMDDDTSQARLVHAFTYFKTTLFDTILASFGPRSLKAFKAEYSKAMNREDVAGDVFRTPETHFDGGDIREADYGSFFRTVNQLLCRFCGKHYTGQLLGEILDQIHWDARTLLTPLIFPENTPTRIPSLNADERCKLLTEVHLFRDVPEEACARLAGCMELRIIAPDDDVVRQDTPCDTFYMVASGVGCSEEWDVTGEMVVGAYLEEGDFFGEAAFMPERESLYGFTVRASARMLVGGIRRRDFEAFMRMFPDVAEQVRENVENLRLLRNTMIFKELSPSLVSFVLARIRHEHYKAGETVITEGELGRRFFIIKRGSAEALIESEGGQRRVGGIKSGDYFGEIALLMDVPRTATVRAVEDLDVGVIDKEDFLSLRQGSREFQEDLETIARKRVESQGSDTDP